MNKINNRSYQYPAWDKEIIAELTDPNYDGGSFALPENPTTLEKTKYKICRNIIAHKLDKKLSTEELAKQIELSMAETKRLLHFVRRVYFRSLNILCQQSI